jgi:hypothetical protein
MAPLLEVAAACKQSAYWPAPAATQDRAGPTLPYTIPHQPPGPAADVLLYVAMLSPWLQPGAYGRLAGALLARPRAWAVTASAWSAWCARPVLP